MKNKINDFEWAVIQPLNGGMPIGFEQELQQNPKYIISNNNKNDIYYINYIKQRNINSPIIKMDWDLKEYKKESEIDKNEYEKIKNVNIVCAVPVCAGLSMLNVQKAQLNKQCDMGRGNPDNIQNQNMYNIAKYILNEIQPKVYVFENAPAVFTNLGKGVLKKLYEIAIKANYSITVEKVNTINHGIPQKRERTFIYFWKSKFAYNVFYEHQNTPNIQKFFDTFIDNNASLQNEYLNGVEDIRDFAWFFIEEHLTKLKNQSIFEFAYDLFGSKFVSSMMIIVKLNKFDELIEYVNKKIDKENDEEKIKKLQKYIKNINYIKNKIENGKGFWDTSNMFHTTNTNYNALISKSLPFLIHPNGKRTLNKRELISLMGLPNDYELNEKNSSKFLSMLTQSVPVNTAKHAAKNCKLFIEGKLIKSNTKLLKCNNIKNGKIKNNELF